MTRAQLGKALTITAVHLFGGGTKRPEMTTRDFSTTAPTREMFATLYRIRVRSGGDLRGIRSHWRRIYIDAGTGAPYIRDTAGRRYFDAELHEAYDDYKRGELA